MREIIFRGRMNDGRWIHGSLDVMEYGSTNIITPDSSFLGRNWRVDPETVGQYTGMCDKRGKKIFEGDIVGASMPPIDCMAGFEWPPNAVCYHQGSFCFMTRHGATWTTLGGFAPAVELEVLGNVHDNPELLGEWENT